MLELLRNFEHQLQLFKNCHNAKYRVISEKVISFCDFEIIKSRLKRCNTAIIKGWHD